VKARPVIPRELAHRDVEEAVAHYLEEGSAPAALGCIDALERACVHIGRDPASGSPGYGLELNLPGVRCWPLARYPHLVFYFERVDQIDVWRVVDAHRDIPPWLRSPEGL
jgi:toxin ParE1/3/4